MLHLAMKAFYPGQAALPAAARRHDLEVPGDVRDARAHGADAGLRADRLQEPGGRGPRHQPLRPRLAAHRHVEDRGAQSRRWTSTASTRPSAAPGATRRRAAPRSGCSPFRTAQHGWDPKNQRPELWKLYNTRMTKGESLRVFPISNWTELDIWQYIHLENIPIVPLYFAAERPVVERDGTLIMVDDDAHAPAPRRGADDEEGALPHPGLLSADRGGGERGRDPARRSSRRCC